MLDGSSLAVLTREFLVHYLGASPADAALPQPMQFREFCASTDARRASGNCEALRTYWRDKLGERLPDWAPPGGSRSLPAIAYDAGVHTITLDGPLRAALMGRGAAAKATLFHTLLTAYFVLLHRVSGQERIVIGIDEQTAPARARTT